MHSRCDWRHLAARIVIANQIAAVAAAAAVAGLLSRLPPHSSVHARTKAAMFEVVAPETSGPAGAKTDCRGL